LIEKYPDVPVEIWDIQEFTYLDADRCKNTSVMEREAIRNEYLTENNPDFVHGKGAESFNQMMHRADNLLDKLSKVETDKFVVIFTHAQFIRAVLARKEYGMVTFTDVFEGVEINNTDIVKLRF